MTKPLALAIATSVCTVLLQLLVTAWVVMITVGVIHGEWLPNLPTIGFHSAYLIGFMLDTLVFVFKYSNSEKE